MKLVTILEKLNSFEKNPFLKTLDILISSDPANSKSIEKYLSELDIQLRNADNNSVSYVFELLTSEFKNHIRSELLSTTSQLDVLIDILIRDGNSLMKREWLAKLYDLEIKSLKSELSDFKKNLDEQTPVGKNRDYKIFANCINTAYTNDQLNNQENKITKDEQSILTTLLETLKLSQKEVKLISYSILPLKKLDIDEAIKYLSGIGLIFYSKKNHQIFVADEVANILREIKGKRFPDKVFRHLLNVVKEPRLNLACRKHSLVWKTSKENKIQSIIDKGISPSDLLLKDLHKEDINKNDIRAFLNELIDSKLEIEIPIRGKSIEDKVENLLTYLRDHDREGVISISHSGYDKLIKDLDNNITSFVKNLKSKFQLQEDNILDPTFLLEHNIRPIDILNSLSEDMIKTFCNKKEISTRGNEIANILESYKDVENLIIENYIHIANRDYNSLIENGIEIKESELGVKFEEVTKSILKKIGFTVNEKVKNTINNSKNKVDIVLTEDDGSLILIECKSIKEKGYNKYSSVSRQVNSYKEQAIKNGFAVKKIFIVAPSFSDDFVNECGLDYELNLSLLTADTLYSLHQKVIKNVKITKLPISLLMRDVLIDKERIMKALDRI